MASKDIEAGRAHVIIRLRDQVTAGLKHVERSVGGFGRNFATLGAAITAGSAGALAFPLKMAADMEQLGIGLEIFMGSASAAQAMMKEIATFAKNTPFGLRDVAENAQSLLRARVAASSVIPVLNALGNASNGEQEKLSGLVLAYSQMMGKGKLIAQEANQMNERGLSPMLVLSEATGRSVTELQQAMEAGAISSEYFTAALQSVYGPGGRLGTILDRQAKSAYGLLGILIDAVSMGLKPLGEAAIEILKPIATFAIGAADAFAAFAAKNQGLAKTVAAVLIGLVAVGGVLTGVGLAALALSTVAGGLAAAWAFAGAVLSATLAALTSPLTVLLGIALLFRSQIAAALSAAVTYMQPFITAIRSIGAIFYETFGGIVGALMQGDLQTAAGIAWLGFVAAAWEGVAQLGNAITVALDFLQAWIPGVDGVRSYISAAFASIGQAILAGRWDVAGAIMMAKIRLVITEGWNAITSVWTGFTVLLESAWDSIVSGIQTTWRSAVTEIAKWLVWLAEQAGFAMDGVKEELDRMNASDQKKADGAQASREQARYNAGAESIAAGEARAAAIRKQIAELEGQAATAYESAGAPTISDAAAKAKADLKTAIAAATDRKEDPAVKQLQQQAAGGMRQVGSVTSSGTFSAAGAAASLGFNARPLEDTARNTKRMVTLLERDRGGEPKFA
jgi:tape measure domain-containing protein